jgi:glyoxylase-like metal-dependent hydrolase (beta-lactamase superfamily II)
LHLLAPYLENFPENAAADDAYAQRIMRRHGIPADLSTVLGAVGAAFRAFGSRGHVTRLLHDGDRLKLRDRELQVMHRPGHSPSDTVFWDQERGILFAGDHLLAHISSNALVSRPLLDGRQDEGVQDADPRPLLTYIRSMEATRELPVELVLPGHGEPITEHAALIDERLRMHERRARKLHRLLGRGPMTAFELALELWGKVAVTQAYLTISEVLGHLDLLVHDGLVRERSQDGMVRFEAVTDRPSGAA